MLEKVKNEVSVLELKRLLVTIIDHKLPICFRYRALGDMWQPNFLKVLKITENGVILNDELQNKLVTVPDLSNIMQFEIDGRIYAFGPNFHYDVTIKEMA
jgi:hypothetical protein